MFDVKTLDFGFIILCPDMNHIGLKNTYKSIKLSHPNCPVVAVVPGLIKPELLKVMKEECPQVVKGKNTITSLLNTGMRNSTSDWSIFLMAGSWLKIKIADKFSRFIEDDSDILFPIVEQAFDFKNCTLNGLCINKKVFKRVGPFAEEGNLPALKEEWAIHAAAYCGSKFKAILGAKIL